MVRAGAMRLGHSQCRAFTGRNCARSRLSASREGRERKKESFLDLCAKFGDVERASPPFVAPFNFERSKTRYTAETRKKQHENGKKGSASRVKTPVLKRFKRKAPRRFRLLSRGCHLICQRGFWEPPAIPFHVRDGCHSVGILSVDG